MNFLGRLGEAGPPKQGKEDSTVEETSPGVWKEFISHKTKLRTGLESNRAKQLIAKRRITRGYKPVGKIS